MISETAAGWMPTTRASSSRSAITSLPSGGRYENRRVNSTTAFCGRLLCMIRYSTTSAYRFGSTITNLQPRREGSSRSSRWTTRSSTSAGTASAASRRAPRRYAIPSSWRASRRVLTRITGMWATPLTRCTACIGLDARRASRQGHTLLNTTLPPPGPSGVPAARRFAAEEHDGGDFWRRLGGGTRTVARAVPRAAAAPGAAALGAGLPQGPDPAGRTEERRADGRPRGAGRPPAAAPLRLHLTLGHRAARGRAGEGGRPAGGRAGRGAGRRRHRAGQAGAPLGRGQAPVLRPARQEGQLPVAGLAHPGQGGGAGRGRPAAVPARGLVRRRGTTRRRGRARDRRVPAEVADRARRDRPRAGVGRPVRARAGRRRVRQGGRVPGRPRGAAAPLRGGHLADPEGLPAGRDARLPGAQAERPAPQAPGALGRERPGGRAARGAAGGVPRRLVAGRDQRSPQGRVRRPACARGRRAG